MAHSLELPEPQKRKREADDNGAQTAHSDRIPQPPPPQSGNSTPINYLSKASPNKLRLIQGDGDSFAELLALIGDYEGVLNRHESLASSLGAKLTGPRLVKAMEGVFEGPITVLPSNLYPNQAPPAIAWLDIVQFAKANPNDLQLITIPEKGRMCQFILKGMQVQITEDDWRLIMSGAIDRFRLAPPHPLEEDENVEVATLDIVESRLHALIKKADEVARKARQLNYHLSGRKAAITSKRTPAQGLGNGYSPTTQPRIGYDLHADLLQQFGTAPSYASAPRSSIHSIPSPGALAVSAPNGSLNHTNASTNGRSTNGNGSGNGNGTGTGTGNGNSNGNSRLSPGSYPESFFREYCPDDPYRPHITARIEKLNKGEVIYPPCDRCRRLKTQCIKHLTACSGCTKKHAKCAWKSLPEDEIAWLRGDVASIGGLGVGDGGLARGPSAEAVEVDVDDSGSNISGSGNVSAPAGPRFVPADQLSGPGTPNHVKPYRRSPPSHPASAMHGFTLREEAPSLTARREPYRAGGYEPMDTDNSDHRDPYDYRDGRDYHSERRGSSSHVNGRVELADGATNGAGSSSRSALGQREMALRDHSLLSLSHVASVASAAAEAREVRSVQSHSVSRGSSSNGHD